MPIGNNGSCYLERLPGTRFPVQNRCSCAAVSAGSSSQEKALSLVILQAQRIVGQFQAPATSTV